MLFFISMICVCLVSISFFKHLLVLLVIARYTIVSFCLKNTTLDTLLGITVVFYQDVLLTYVEKLSIITVLQHICLGTWVLKHIADLAFIMWTVVFFDRYKCKILVACILYYVFWYVRYERR